MKLSNNFFSENVEAVLLETLNKNVTLTEIVFTGNRFSHSCFSKVKKITVRNHKMLEEQEEAVKKQAADEELKQA